VESSCAAASQPSTGVPETATQRLMETRIVLVPDDWDLPVGPGDAALETAGSAR